MMFPFPDKFPRHASLRTAERRTGGDLPVTGEHCSPLWDWVISDIRVVTGTLVGN